MDRITDCHVGPAALLAMAETGSNIAVGATPYGRPSCPVGRAQVAQICMNFLENVAKQAW